MSTANPLGARPALTRPLRLGAGPTRRVVDRMVADLPVRLRYPDGSVAGGGGADAPTIEIVRPRDAFARIASAPKIGIGESYMAGDWYAAEGTDLADVLTPFAARMATLVPRPLVRLRRCVDRRVPRTSRNTVTGARRNIEAHYDLSNALFAEFLDPTLSYSSALFDARAPLAGQDLGAAQERKIEAVLDRAGVRAGSRVLEIGSGWGSLAAAAGRRGARVTSVTISPAQHGLARRRVAEAGLADRVDIRLQDYRQVEGRYDAVVSVEMIEAVGIEYWPTYFDIIDRRLAPGGRVVLQAILMAHDRLQASCRSHSWIQKYIFPGGVIPSLTAIEATLRQHTALGLTARHHFGPHYAETLRRWRYRFLARWPQVTALGFDERFRRMWEFYLAYSEAGFAVGYLDVAHLELARVR
ncbi:cyclopropane-fatty-acyl-phospholipid synthase [Pilimelia terevasa]|uniref:Cyclopropane-fatty-acyl-phospholipid synthase n=1 Tax=Pilimelia terevasa TaxID=53372 RepID=A0A8J3FKR7_9ACTN|nr:cyclopropane-fatty-acyl-phospholipid synthase family protein [Pilimelia terevasa]GGK42693.1 cyclopropane-fatty-acyl-phospholipid synthase [Pilimelia terevasa]